MCLSGYCLLPAFSLGWEIPRIGSNQARAPALNSSSDMGTLRNVEVRIFRRLRREAPQGKIHRLAFWLFIIYLALSAGQLLPGTAAIVFQWVSDAVLFLLVILCIPLLAQWIFGRLLWRVRDRLIVTYLLMGLAPVVLFVLLALISLYMFSGQFAIFAATAEASLELEHISAENRALAMHVAHVAAAGPGLTSVTLPEMEDTTPEKTWRALRVAAFEDGNRIAIIPAGVNSSEMTGIPRWATDRFRGVVFDKGRLYLRAIDMQTIAGHKTTVISSMPLEKSVLDNIARGLGTITVLPEVGLGDSSGNTLAQAGPGSRKLTKKQIEALSIIGGVLPPPRHFYDITVTFLAPVETTDWATGKLRETVTHVSSRPSLLYQRLFITSLQIADFVQDVLIAIAILFGLLELIAFLMAMRLNRTITRSIHDLYGATVQIDSGNFDHRIRVTRNDQLAALSAAFNRMTASLQKLLIEQREKERLQSELAIAQEVQANLFPRGKISLPMLELHGACYPARTVSGDYYDFLVFGSAGLGLALGDISGKGISAALLMATLHSAVRAYRFAGEELITAGNRAVAVPGPEQVGEEEIECGELFEQPGKILGLLNRHLYRSTQPEKYATLFLAHYDGASSRLVYSNGGQLPPLLLRADDTITRLDCGGTVVGLMDGMVYEQGTEHLRPGDILVAYSDGVTEPENEFGDFGEARLMEIVRRHRHLPLEAISDQVMQSLRNWISGQEQPDDITLVLARQK